MKNENRAKLHKVSDYEIELLNAVLQAFNTSENEVLNRNVADGVAKQLKVCKRALNGLKSVVNSLDVECQTDSAYLTVTPCELEKTNVYKKQHTQKICSFISVEIHSLDFSINSILNSNFDLYESQIQYLKEKVKEIERLYNEFSNQLELKYAPLKTEKKAKKAHSLYKR